MRRSCVGAYLNCPQNVHTDCPESRTSVFSEVVRCLEVTFGIFTESFAQPRLSATRLQFTLAVRRCRVDQDWDLVLTRFGLRRPGVLWKLQSTEDDGGRIPKEGNASGLLDEAFH